MGWRPGPRPADAAPAGRPLRQAAVPCRGRHAHRMGARPGRRLSAGRRRVRPARRRRRRHRARPPRRRLRRLRPDRELLAVHDLNVAVRPVSRRVRPARSAMDLPETMMHRSQPRRRAYVETYGCQMNISDAELMQGILAAQGFDLAQRPEEADVILVNTCAVREHAAQRVLGRVGQLNRLKKRRPDLVIGVTGCMAQRMGETLLARAPFVELVMGPDGYRRLPDALRAVRPDWGVPAQALLADPADGRTAAARASARKELPVLGVAAAEAPAAAGVAARDNGSGTHGQHAVPQRVAVLDFEPHENYEGLEVRRGSRVSAWVPIQRGCDYRCTYCIVPYTRGSEKNRDPERMLAEVREIAAQGIPEVVLLGQTVN